MHSIEVARGWVADIAQGWEKDFIPDYQVDPGKLKHLAIIPDGNRRAALEMGLKPYLGHLAGVEVTKGIARAARFWGVHTLTVWAFSTENWHRRKEQTDFVLDLAQKHLSRQDFLEELVKNETRFRHLGRRSRLPEPLLRTLRGLEEQTADFNRFKLNLALDYGGANELARAIEHITVDHLAGSPPWERGQLAAEPDRILPYLDTAGQSPVDLVVRTGLTPGELPHTSGFMPLQTAYAAWDFMTDLYPNLTPEKLLHSIQKFENYQRRMGR